MIFGFKDFAILHMLIIFLYEFGFIALRKFFSNFFRENNIYINLAGSWFIGNALISLILMMMFFVNLLNFINIKSFFVIFIITSVFFFYFLGKTIIIRKLNYPLFLLLILLFFLPQIISSQTSFLIWWDAVAIWFFKAKALFYDNFFNFIKDNRYLFSSQSYPLGIPLLISSYYRLIGKINDQAIQLYFLMFYLNLVILSFGILINFFGKKINRFVLLLIVLSFYISTNFIIYSHNGYLDLILGSVFAFCFYLFLSFFDKREISHKKDLFRLISIFLGYSLILKNEAIPFFIVISISLLIFSLFENKKINLKDIFFSGSFLLISISPFLFWQIYLKINQIPSFIDGHHFDFLKIENLKRIKTIINYLYLETFNTNKYNLSLISFLFLFIFQISFLAGNHRLKLKSLLLISIIFAQLLSYIYIYTITPFPYISHIESSLERLFLHLLPMFFIINGFYAKEIINSYSIRKN